MIYAKLIRRSGFLNIFVSILWLLWWVQIGILTLTSGNLNLTTFDLVRLNGYQIISIIGLIACILSPIGIMGLYLPQAEKLGKLGLAGFLLISMGVILYGCLQYEETFTWPILAAQAPGLLASSGGLMSDIAYFSGYIAMGIVFSIGFILFGVTNWRAKTFPRWAVLLFAVGALLFGVGMAVMIRTLGLMLWVIGWGRMGYMQIRTKVV